MQLTPEVRLVAGGDGGFSLSDPYDCHVYLVESEGEAALIDTPVPPAGGGERTSTSFGPSLSVGLP